MRILLIKPKHIGDTLLLTPTIRAIKQAYPDADIWVMVRKDCEGILAGCPEITRIVTLAGVEKSERRPGDVWHGIGVLVRQTMVNFDYVFELGDGHRGRLFAMLARTKRRYSVKTGSPLKPRELKRFMAMSAFDWTTRHRIEKDFYTVSEFLPLTEPIPALVYEESGMQPWNGGPALHDYCVMQIGSRQGFARWDREGWAKVGRAMLRRFENIVISCGPVAHETEEAAWLQNELGLRAMNTRGALNWPQMAWLLHRARLYIGPSTAAMHLAAACRCPVVALFGPTIEDHWHPWQVPYRIVTVPGYVTAANPVERYARIRGRTMQEVQAHDVVEACDDLMAEIGTPHAP
jgi:heptosyltransferase-3